MLKHGLIRKEVRPEDATGLLMSPANWGESDEGPVFDRFVQLGPRAWPVVMEELSDANTSAREVAIVAAERLCNPQAVEAVTPLLADKDRELRLAACYALVRMGTTGAVQAAFDAACDEKDHYVQTVMMLQFAYSHEAQAMSALIAGLKHSKVEVRRACAYCAHGIRRLAGTDRVERRQGRS